ncbi:hypothetical protein SODALDRAFT_157173 [Sodiomyces alkalinus F11]|uniref:Uncharacterized protein n=1 Tax=Sodiomyces alkalinus (strain CBS 110278 / VKM F-3762 / F11) TaxID=1314773 RepID=A0A3N2PXY8_SODAK|nr:hypothetical protein SODALDRAFT_157173 [Sodiomyces alkalinus F11]ROT39334.1 hypothetical protein SODALDRAFT_157173 [Sodiomyces alkalinus F11]
MEGILTVCYHLVLGIWSWRSGFCLDFLRDKPAHLPGTFPGLEETIPGQASGPGPEPGPVAEPAAQPADKAAVVTVEGTKTKTPVPDQEVGSGDPDQVDDTPGPKPARECELERLVKDNLKEVESLRTEIAIMMMSQNSLKEGLDLLLVEREENRQHVVAAADIANLQIEIVKLRRTLDLMKKSYHPLTVEREESRQSVTTPPVTKGLSKTERLRKQFGIHQSPTGLTATGSIEHPRPLTPSWGSLLLPPKPELNLTISPIMSVVDIKPPHQEMKSAKTKANLTLSPITSVADIKPSHQEMESAEPKAKLKLALSHIIPVVDTKPPRQEMKPAEPKAKFTLFPIVSVDTKPLHLETKPVKPEPKLTLSLIPSIDIKPRHQEMKPERAAECPVRAVTPAASASKEVATDDAGDSQNRSESLVTVPSVRATEETKVQVPMEKVPVLLKEEEHVVPRQEEVTAENPVADSAMSKQVDPVPAQLPNSNRVVFTGGGPPREEAVKPVFNFTPTSIPALRVPALSKPRIRLITRPVQNVVDKPQFSQGGPPTSQPASSDDTEIYDATPPGTPRNKKPAAIASNDNEEVDMLDAPTFGPLIQNPPPPQATKVKEVNMTDPPRQPSPAIGQAKPALDTEMGDAPLHAPAQPSRPSPQPRPKKEEEEEEEEKLSPAEVVTAFLKIRCHRESAELFEEPLKGSRLRRRRQRYGDWLSAVKAEFSMESDHPVTKPVTSQVTEVVPAKNDIALPASPAPQRPAPTCSNHNTVSAPKDAAPVPKYTVPAATSTTRPRPRLPPTPPPAHPRTPIALPSTPGTAAPSDCQTPKPARQKSPDPTPPLQTPQGKATGSGPVDSPSTVASSPAGSQKKIVRRPKTSSLCASRADLQKRQCKVGSGRVEALRREDSLSPNGKSSPVREASLEPATPAPKRVAEETTEDSPSPMGGAPAPAPSRPPPAPPAERPVLPSGSGSATSEPSKQQPDPPATSSLAPEPVFQFRSNNNRPMRRLRGTPATAEQREQARREMEAAEQARKEQYEEAQRKVLAQGRTARKEPGNTYGKGQTARKEPRNTYRKEKRTKDRVSEEEDTVMRDDEVERHRDEGRRGRETRSGSHSYALLSGGSGRVSGRDAGKGRGTRGAGVAAFREGVGHPVQPYPQAVRYGGHQLDGRHDGGAGQRRDLLRGRLRVVAGEVAGSGWLPSRGDGNVRSGPEGNASADVFLIRPLPPWARRIPFIRDSGRAGGKRKKKSNKKKSKTRNQQKKKRGMQGVSLFLSGPVGVLNHISIRFLSACILTAITRELSRDVVLFLSLPLGG